VSMCSTVTVTAPPLPYLHALDSRHSIFSMNQCLSEIMPRQSEDGRGFTFKIREGFKCLQILANKGTISNATELMLLQFLTSTVRSDQIRTGQVRSEQVRTGQVRSGQDRTGQVRSGQVRLGQVRTGQDRTGHDWF
jgi:hypothetical protein